MMENLKNKYKLITHEKELADIQRLAEIVRDSDWLEKDTILVNCFPEYSSVLTQYINHRLSHLNDNELFEVINLPMPYPNMNQVWDEVDKVYRNYIRYLSEWTRKNILGNNYLFLSLTSAGPNLATLYSVLRGRMDRNSYRFATLYKEKHNIFNPDFYADEYDELERTLILHWENLDVKLTQ